MLVLLKIAAGVAVLGVVSMLLIAVSSGLMASISAARRKNDPPV